ncbi:MAG: M24 family metallopeptidase, partial [Clostridia bacterium]
MNMNVCENLFDNCGLDALIILSPSNTLYLSGYNSTNCQIVLTKDVYYFVTDMRYFFEAKTKLDGKFVVVVADGNGIGQIVEILAKHMPKTVGWDSGIFFKDYVNLKNAFVNFGKFVDIANNIAECRDIKQAEEIEKIKMAQVVTDKAFEYIITQIKEGVTEVEIAAKLEYFILKNNCQLAFDSIVAFGKNTSNPHSHRSLNKLEKGQFVTMDLGAKFG